VRLQLSENLGFRYVYKVERGVDVRLPGLYEWHIEGVGSYIGKYKRIRRPTPRVWTEHNASSQRAAL